MAAGWTDLTGDIKDLFAKYGVAWEGFQTATGVINVPAMIVIALVTLLLVIGIKESANVNSVIVIIKVAIVIVFIVAGIGYVSTANWGGSFIPENTGEFGKYGWSGILRAAGVVFFAYIGFDAVSTAAQEAKNPQRDMPRGILASLAICTVLYILVSFVLTGIVEYKRLDVPDPIAVGVDAIGLSWLSPIVKAGAIAGLSSVILVMLLGQTRIFISMAKGVLVLRITQPDVERPFRTPAVWITAPLGAIFAIVLMAGLPGKTWLRLVIWMAVGFLIYFFYGARNSRLAHGKKPVPAAVATGFDGARSLPLPVPYRLHAGIGQSCKQGD